MKLNYVLIVVCVLGAANAVCAAADNTRVTPVVLAYQKAKPAIVNISAAKTASVGYGLLGDDLFDRIFPRAFSGGVPVESVGSGFVIHPDGYIITNAHVVLRAQKIVVTLDGDVKCPAKVISADQKYDLAVIKIDPPKGAKLAHLLLGRSDDLMVGETVIAVGNPLGFANSLTTGVVSAIDRKLQFDNGAVYSGLIQIDAPINPGNSGGPLLNINGELIGVNTAIRADAQNIGFAIPVDVLSEQLDRLLDFQRLNRVIFGASVGPLRQENAAELAVKDVRPGTPADKSLRMNDRILAIDGVPMKQMPDYSCLMLSTKAGQTVTFKCLRDGNEVTAAVTLQVKPRPDGKALAKNLFGMTVRTIDAELARNLRLPLDSGLVVVELEKGGPADVLGIAPRDVLFQVGNFYVKDTDDLGTVLEDVTSSQVVKIGIARHNVAALLEIHAR